VIPHGHVTARQRFGRRLWSENRGREGRRRCRRRCWQFCGERSWGGCGRWSWCSCGRIGVARLAGIQSLVQHS
jgi:hypothetical protein